MATTKKTASDAPARGALAIRRVPIASLHNDPANARAHDERNLDAITASLQRFGQAEPLIVHGPTGRVIGGNGRLVAMRKLGWSEVDVVELDVDDLEATALGIALNRTADLGAWNEPALAQLLKTLAAEDALVGTGFDDADIRELLAGLDEVHSDDVDDQGPEPPPTDATTLPGDLWVLGKHRLLCGDSTKPDDLARLMAGEQAVLLSTDPPYCVDYTGNDRPIHDGRPSGKDWSALYREVDIKDLGEFMDGVFTACLPHVLTDAAIYVWHAHVQQPVIAATFERHGLLLHQVLVWVKPVATFGHAYYRWRHEPCAFGWRRGHNLCCSTKPLPPRGGLPRSFECLLRRRGGRGFVGGDARQDAGRSEAREDHRDELADQLGPARADVGAVGPEDLAAVRQRVE